MKIIAFLFTAFISLQMSGQEKFPDGTPIPDWFRQNEIVNIDTLGKKYTITDYGVANDSTILQTEKIQAVIDRAAENGGGVIIIPKGTFLSGSIFFKPKTHLYMEEGAVLKGSDDISNFAIVNTRIEGQSLKYFAAPGECRQGKRIYHFRQRHNQRQRAQVLEIFLAAPAGYPEMYQYGRVASPPGLHLQQ